MKNKFIDIQQGDIVSIFTYGFNRIYVATQLVKELNNNKVIIFNSGSNTYRYFPCKRVEMGYGWDLKDMINDFKKDFSIAIINCLSTHFNSKETNDFIKYIKENPEMKKKTFILIIKTSFESFKKGDRLDYKYFKCYKNSIINFCNKHYSFYDTTSDSYNNEWYFENLLTKEKSCYQKVDWGNYSLKLSQNKE